MVCQRRTVLASVMELLRVGWALPPCYGLRRDGLNVWELLALPGAGRAARERRPLPGHVCVVGVAARGRHVGQGAGPGGRTTTHQVAAALEPAEPAQHLRADSDLVEHQTTQPPPAVADLLGGRGDPGSAGQQGQRPTDLGARTRSVVPDHGVAEGPPDQVDPLRGGRLGQPAREVTASPGRRRPGRAAPPPARAPAPRREHREPAAVTVSWTPRLGSGVVDRPRAGRGRPTRWPTLVLRDFGAPAHPTSSGSPSGSTNVSDVDGIPTVHARTLAYTTS